MGKLIYIRHGQASVLSDNYDQLSDLGKRQALDLGRFLAREGVKADRLYTGPMQRHLQTTEGIIDGSGQSLEPVIMDNLREHQGFSAMKKVLPQLIASDEEINRLAGMPWNSREEQIKHHMRVYENFSLRWAKGEFDHLINGEFQSWDQFVRISTEAYNRIVKECRQGMTCLVVTSGGPKAVACGLAMGLSRERIMRTSWVIFNCGVSEMLISGDRMTLRSFNNITFFNDRYMRTLV